jgi:hypothetical protein
MTDIIDQLKEGILNSEERVKVWREELDHASNVVKAAEGYLKDAKTRKNKAYKEWVLARKCVTRAKSRLTGVPYRLRKYAKEHIGEVFEKMTKGA